MTQLESTEQLTGKNTFFCPSVYSNDEKATRAKKNVLSIGGLWIDCDFKDYENDAEAIEKLKVLTTQIPPTATFFTGGGLHLYWLFTQPIPVDSWMPVARQWKSYVMGLDATRDPKTLANPATLMRLPGAWTEKRGKWVEGNYHPDIIYDFESIRTFLGAPAATTSSPTILDNVPTYAMGEGTMIKLDDWAPVDAEIVENNCRMCQEFRSCGGKVIEPQWFSFAGLSKFFIKGDDWFHDISSGDPRYQQGQAQDYLDRAKSDREAPTSCEELMEGWGQDPSNNPCNDCSFKGQIRSPWDITKRVAPPAPNIPESISVPITTIGLPKGYQYVGQVICKVTAVEIEGQTAYDTIPIYDRPMNPIAIVFDEADGCAYLYLTSELGRKGWKEIRIKLEDISKPATLLAALANQSIIVGMKEGAALANYVRKQYNHMLDHTEEHTLHSCMGWTPNRERFICGDKCYRPNEDPTTFTLSRDLLEHQLKNNANYESKGTLEEWRNMVKEAIGHPGLKDRRAVLAMGFAAPLVDLTSYDSAVVAVYGDSGCGKSGILRLISSIYGQPNVSHLTQNDTSFGASKILASIGSLPVCYDEITSLDRPEDIKDMIFQMSRGKTKNAGTKEGGVRAIETWKTMMFTTSNSSIYDILLSDHHAEAGGEIYRTLEIGVQSLEYHNIKHSGAVDDHIVNGAYGVAGEVWLQHVVDNRASIQRLMVTIARKIQDRVGDKSPERFWTGLVGAGAVVSAYTCKRLGIYPFDVKEVMNTVCDMIETARDNISGDKLGPVGYLEQYIRENIPFTITLSSDEAKIDSPIREVYIRAIDKGNIYIARKEFKKWCTDQRLNMNKLLRELDAEGCIIDRNQQVAILKGTSLPAIRPRCIVLDGTKINVEEIMNERAA